MVNSKANRFHKQYLPHSESLSTFVSSTHNFVSVSPNFEELHKADIFVDSILGKWALEARLQRPSSLLLPGAPVGVISIPSMTRKWRNVFKALASNGLSPLKIVLPLLEHAHASGYNNIDSNIFFTEAILSHLDF